MKKLRTVIAAFFCAFLVLGVAASCNGGDDSTKITSIDLDQKNITLFTIDAAKKLTATVEPGDTSGDELVWSVDKNGIVSLSATTGLSVDVAPVAAGTAVITVAAKNNPEVKKTCSVTVKVPAVNSLQIDKTNLTLAFIFNPSEKLTATTTADTGADATVTWSSSDSGIASVSADGTVSAVSEGSATITATAGSKIAQCEVSVKVPKEIRTPEEFIAIGKDDDSLAGYYFMSGDIDFDGCDFNGVDGGLGALRPLAKIDQGNAVASSKVGFTGLFDGCGYALRNLTIGQRAGEGQSGANGNRASIFGNIAASGVVRNLAVIDFNLEATGRRSGTIANFVFGKLENIYLKGTAKFTNNDFPANSWDRSGAIISALRAGGVMNNVVADIDTLSGSTGTGVIAAVNLQHSSASSPSVGPNASASNIFVVADRVQAYSATGAAPASPAVVLTQEVGGRTLLVGIDQTGGGSHSDNLSNAVNLFENSTIGTVDFSKLPDNMWENNVASEATELPTLKGMASIAIPVTDIALNEPDEVLPANVDWVFEPVITPASASYQKLVYEVEASKEGVATFDAAKGILTTVGTGTIDITIRWLGDPNNIFATCTIEVDVTKISEANGVSLSKESLDLYVGGTSKDVTNWKSYFGSDTLTATVTSVYGKATDQTVAWTSSDSEVVTVADGVVTAIKAGTATIKAAAVENAEFFAECEVTVAAPTIITDVEGFKAMNNDYSGYYILGNDIEFDDATIDPIGDQEKEGGHAVQTGTVPKGWRGIFDGNGYSLRNFKLGGTNYNKALFPGLYGGIIRNVALENVTTSDGNRAGLLVNSVYGGLIENVYLQGTIENTSPASTESYSAGGTVFGGTGDRANEIFATQNIDGRLLTIRDVVTNVTVTGDRKNQTYAVAARIGQGHTTSTTLFERLFVVVDGLDSARQTGNVAADGNTIVSGATILIKKSGAAQSGQTAIASVDFSALDSNIWELNAGELPTLKKGLTPSDPVTPDVTVAGTAALSSFNLTDHVTRLGRLEGDLTQIVPNLNFAGVGFAVGAEDENLKWLPFFSVTSVDGDADSAYMLAVDTDWSVVYNVLGNLDYIDDVAGSMIDATKKATLANGFSGYWGAPSTGNGVSAAEIEAGERLARNTNVFMFGAAVEGTYEVTYTCVNIDTLEVLGQKTIVVLVTAAA